MNNPDLATLADRVARLRPDWRDLSGFYQQRSQLAHELRRLAADASAGHAHQRPQTEQGWKRG